MSTSKTFLFVSGVFCALFVLASSVHAEQSSMNREIASSFSYQPSDIASQEFPSSALANRPVSEKIVRELEQLYPEKHSDPVIDSIPRADLQKDFFEESSGPFNGYFVGRSDELKKLQGGFDLPFLGGRTATLYVKSDLRWHVGDDRNKSVVIRARRGLSLGYDYNWRRGNDFWSEGIVWPIKVSLQAIKEKLGWLDF